MLRVPVTAYLGATEFARFHVDLVAGLAMTGVPEDAAPLVPVELPGIVGVRYRVYPIVDHVADKVCALLEVHPRVVATFERAELERLRAAGDRFIETVFAGSASSSSRGDRSPNDSTVDACCPRRGWPPRAGRTPHTARA